MNTPFDGPHEVGFGLFGLLGIIVWGFFALLALAVAVGLIFLLVRFLLVATRAAQLYISRNGRATPGVAPGAPDSPPAEPATSSVAPPTSTAPTAPTAPPTAPGTPPTAGSSASAGKSESAGKSARVAAPVTKTAATKPVTKPRTRKAPATGELG